MKLQVKQVTTSQILQIFIQDSSSLTGAGLTGLTNASSGLVAYYHKDLDTTATAIALVTMTVGTFTSSGFKEIDASNMPGWYQFCPPDTAFSTGKHVAFHLKGATNMAPLPIEVQMVSYDPYDTVRLGLTALPNAAAEAAGGLYTRGTGAGQINQDGNGRIDTNTKTWIGGAIPAVNVTGVPLVDDKYLLGTVYSTPATAGIQDINVKNINNVAAATPGASGGILISGTNAGTTTLGALTCTGSFTISDGLLVSRSTSNTSAATFTGNGTGNGIVATSGSGATGDGFQATSVATNGNGFVTTGIGTGNGFKAASVSGSAIAATASVSGDGITATGAGTTKHGMNLIAGGSTSNGLKLKGGSTSGAALQMQTTSGHGIDCATNILGAGAHGAFFQGGNTGHGIYSFGFGAGFDGIRAEGAASNGNGLNCLAGGSGYYAINAASIQGSLSTLAGHTAQTGDTFARLGAPSGASTAADIATITTQVNKMTFTVANEINANTRYINGSSAAAASLALSAGTMASGTAITGTLTTTQFTTDLTNNVDDNFVGRTVIFTGGGLDKQARAITAYNGTTKLITVSPAFTAAPANTNPFIIV